MSKFEKNEVAFLAVTDKSGNVSLRSTLTRLECALTVAILAEFVEQSRTFDEEIKKILETRKANFKIEAENRKRERQNLQPLDKIEVPQSANVGQNTDDLPDKLKHYLLAYYNINAFDRYTDVENTTQYEVLTFHDIAQNGDNSPAGFTNGTEQLAIDYENAARPACETVHGVETWHCIRENGERVDVIKRKADKFIFLNLTKFWKKYFKNDLQGKDFERVTKAVLNLGKKQVPCIDESGQFTDTQFFSTYLNAFHFGRDFYALLRLDTPNLFAGVDTGETWLKLTEDYENILSNLSDVEIRLWLHALEIRAKYYKYKKFENGYLDEKTCQQLFEEYGTPSDVAARNFARFWPNFRTAALRLTEDKTYLFFNVNGSPLTESTEAKKDDKVKFGINMQLIERRAPELNQ